MSIGSAENQLMLARLKIN